jgi:FixJ family two-component response regulator/AraC-like DNA-binding protein
MSHDTPIVFVVDDDISVRAYLEALVRSEGWETKTFRSAKEFLSYPRILVPSCLILETSLPDLSGLDLQKRLVAEGTNIPIIFITGYADIAQAVQAMKAGAVEFLSKPFGDDAVLSAIRQALERSRTTLDHEVEIRRLLDHYASLSSREREVTRSDSIGTLMKVAPAPQAHVGGLSPNAMHRVREYVELHLSETIDLSTLAAVAGLSMHHFARQFKQSFGVPPHHYLTQRRLELAQALLTTTELPLSEIAYAVGFSDQSHLARRFRQALATTPRAFRESRRGRPRSLKVEQARPPEMAGQVSRPTPGKVNGNTASRGSLVSTHSRPPWAPMIDRQIDHLKGSA